MRTHDATYPEDRPDEPFGYCVCSVCHNDCKPEDFDECLQLTLCETCYRWIEGAKAGVWRRWLAAKAS